LKSEKAGKRDHQKMSKRPNKAGKDKKGSEFGGKKRRLSQGTLDVFLAKSTVKSLTQNGHQAESPKAKSLDKEKKRKRILDSDEEDDFEDQKATKPQGHASVNHFTNGNHKESKTSHQVDVDDEVDPLLCFDNDVEMSNGSEKKEQKSPLKSKPAIVSNDDDDDFEEEVKPPKRKQAPKKEPIPEKQPRKQKVD